MKKSTIAFVAVAALMLLAVPTIAFANGARQVWCPESGAEAPASCASATGGGASALSDSAACAASSEPADALAREGLVGGAVAGTQGHAAVGRGNCPGFVDADADGMCDNCGSGACPGFVDENGDGACDARGSDRGACPGFVDADGDGMCDNYGSGACVRGDGAGRGHQGNGGGRGCANR
ncbi:hypothetical protein B5F40_14065 [Gordonibacter sp. An230]|uniref:hypothetical protein n=1 Tax=Gordonibacter sp. An230 TaxID=1965592 RepID=UPI000B3773BC|nr:hypothetical protein [Gordonibacter sp. An230]OUO87121.1 hypothetical protein B5F40_14065 [Gordonibacter sp. An230]